MEGPAGKRRKVADRVLQRHRYRAAAFISLPFQMSGARSQEPGRRPAPRSLTAAGQFGPRSWFLGPGSCFLTRACSSVG